MTSVDGDLRSGRRLETGRRSESIICIHAYLTSEDNELVYTCIRSGNSVYKYIKLTYILGKV
jgi:hypothetical protein